MNLFYYPLKYSSIALAAFFPAPIAFITVAAPVTVSLFAIQWGYYNIISLCIWIQRVIMGMKTISIRDDVYDLVKNLKREDESFSDVIGKLVKERKTKISEYFGVLKESKVLDDIEDDCRKIRSNHRN